MEKVKEARDFPGSAWTTSQVVQWTSPPSACRWCAKTRPHRRRTWRRDRAPWGRRTGKHDFFSL